MQEIIHSFPQMLGNVALDVSIDCSSTHAQHRHLSRVKHLLLLIELLSDQSCQLGGRHSEYMSVGSEDVLVIQHDYVPAYDQLYLCNGLAGLEFTQ